MPEVREQEISGQNSPLKADRKLDGSKASSFEERFGERTVRGPQDDETTRPAMSPLPFARHRCLCGRVLIDDDSCENKILPRLRTHAKRNSSNSQRRGSGASG